MFHSFLYRNTCTLASSYRVRHRHLCFLQGNTANVGMAFHDTYSLPHITSGAFLVDYTCSFLWVLSLLLPETISVFNTMKTIRYSINIDADVKYPQTKFEEEVAIYLSNPDGWGQLYDFVQVDQKPQVVIHLSSPAGIQAAGCDNPELSCAQMGGMHMRLNVMRWLKGSAESKLSLEDYRQYLVSHEMGHILGHDHVDCPGHNQPAPIMMQQTLGIGACKANKKLTKIDLVGHF